MINIMFLRVIYPNRFALYFFAIVIIVIGTAYFYSQWILIEMTNSLAEAERVEKQLGTPSTKSDPTANWKTYRNEEFGFEVGYPGYWELGKVISDDERRDVAVAFSHLPNRYTGLVDAPEGLVVSLFYSETSAESVTTVEKIDASAGASSTYGVLTCTQNSEEVGALCYAKSEKGIVIINISIIESEVVDYDSDVEKMLLSFQFIESEVDTGGWKTYRNEEFGFEFKMPFRWSNALVRQDRGDFFGGYIFNIILEQFPVCNFYVYSHDNWRKFQNSDDVKPIYVTENDDYVVSRGCGHDDYGYEGFEEYNNRIADKNFDTVSGDDAMGPFNEFRLIIVPTFKFIE
jgi:hypothetical protein